MLINHGIHGYLQVCVYMFVYTAIAYATFVLFGAPLLSNQTGTLIISLVFAACSGLPFLVKYVPTAENARRILWSASSPYDRFASCCFWGTLGGTWSSAFFLVLDWDRPWQAWPIPCVVGALIGESLGLLLFALNHWFGCTSSCIDRLPSYTSSASAKEVEAVLARVLEFLSTFSWVYSFKWVHLLSNSGDVNCDPVIACPADWKEALCSSSVQQLQDIVIGNVQPTEWPESLRTFVEQCITLTQQLTHLVSRLPQASTTNAVSFSVLPHGCLSTGGASFLSYNPSPSPLSQHKKIKLKKQHEIESMSSFICDMLHQSLTLNDDSERIGKNTNRTFQTETPIIKSTGGVESLSSSKLVITDTFDGLVDIGSGLGHLPNYIMRRLAADRRNDSAPRQMVLAVEADHAMHTKSVAVEAQKKCVEDRLFRHCFRVNNNNLDELKLFCQSTLTSKGSGSNYLLCGLHCCGDLSESVIQLFQSDPHARGLALVGCCYHKMTPGTFPISDRLKSAFSNHPAVIGQLSRTSALRLACQWSPLQWCDWSPLEIYQHRVRVFTRSILEVYFNPPNSEALRRIVLINPLKFTPSPALNSNVDQPLPQLMRHWATLDSLEDDVYANELDRLSNSEEALAVWRLLPGLTALQQVIQPLLEALVLADRIWKLEIGTSFSTLVRLFSPKLSPRCMVLVANK